MDTPAEADKKSEVKPATRERIEELKGRVLNGGEIAFDEALELIAVEEPARVDFLLEAAREITFHFNSDKPGLCALVNAKSNLCGEDFGF